MVSVTVDTSGLDSLISDARKGLGEAGKRLVPELNRVAAENFAAEGARGDQPKWDRTTLVGFAGRVTNRNKGYADVRREYHAGQWTTGVDTGELRQSWGATSGMNGDTLEVLAIPAAAHGPGFHAGGPATIDGQSVTLPARMVTLSEADADLAEALILEAILG